MKKIIRLKDLDPKKINYIFSPFIIGNFSDFLGFILLGSEKDYTGNLVLGKSKMNLWGCYVKMQSQITSTKVVAPAWCKISLSTDCDYSEIKICTFTNPFGMVIGSLMFLLTFLLGIFTDWLFLAVSGAIAIVGGYLLYSSIKDQRVLIDMCIAAIESKTV